MARVAEILNRWPTVAVPEWCLGNFRFITPTARDAFVARRDFILATTALGWTQAEKIFAAPIVAAATQSANDMFETDNDAPLANFRLTMEMKRLHHILTNRAAGMPAQHIDIVELARDSLQDRWPDMLEQLLDWLPDKRVECVIN